jgi:hypothetical protein
VSRSAPSRELVVEVCRTLLERGYLKATEGNVSVRVPGEDSYAITPSSYDYGKMEPGDICVLGLDGRHLLGVKKASIEASMHAAVYERRPDVSVIIHTHQPYASALALMERPIPALFDEQVRYLGRSVELVSYAPSGTSFLKKNVAKKLASGANAYILDRGIARAFHAGRIPGCGRSRRVASPPRPGECHQAERHRRPLEKWP